MIYLSSKNKMACRHCNKEIPLPEVCPSCHNAYMRSVGLGAEKLESDIKKIFPQAVVSHFDQDSKAFPKNADIVIVTQAVFQVRNTMQFDLMGIINFDSELYHMDFRTSHRAFSFLVACRLLVKDKVLVQTSLRDNYCLKLAAAGQYEEFYKKELSLRKELGFPPYVNLVKVLIRGINEEQVIIHSQKLFDMLIKKEVKGITVLDPHPDVAPKLRDQYRYGIYLKGSNVRNILSLAKEVIKKVRVGKNIVTINVE